MKLVKVEYWFNLYDNGNIDVCDSEEEAKDMQADGFNKTVYFETEIEVKE